MPYAATTAPAAPAEILNSSAMSSSSGIATTLPYAEAKDRKPSTARSRRVLGRAEVSV